MKSLDNLKQERERERNATRDPKTPNYTPAMSTRRETEGCEKWNENVEMEATLAA